MGFEPLQPVPRRLRSDGKGSGLNLAGARNPGLRIRPQKKRQDGARRATRIAEVEVVTTGVIEVDRAFDKPQAQQPGVEIQGPLGVRCDRGDVMQSGNRQAHAG
jgi:hypothetical protein